jgi:hypothetical protein
MTAWTDIDEIQTDDTITAEFLNALRLNAEHLHERTPSLMFHGQLTTTSTSWAKLSTTYCEVTFSCTGAPVVCEWISQGYGSVAIIAYVGFYLDDVLCDSEGEERASAMWYLPTNPGGNVGQSFRAFMRFVPTAATHKISVVTKINTGTATFGPYASTDPRGQFYVHEE